MLVVGILCANVCQLNLLMVINLEVKRKSMPICTEMASFYKHVWRVFRIRREVGFISGVVWSWHFLALWGTALHTLEK